MKYNELKKVEEVYSSFKIENNYLSYYKKDKCFYLYNLDMELLSKINFDSDYPYQLIENNIYFSCENILKRLDIWNNKLENFLVTDSEFITVINNKLIILSIYNMNLNIEQNKISTLLDGCQLWNFDELLFLLIIGDCLLFSNRKKNMLCLKKSHSGEEIWGYSLGENKVYGNLLKYLNILIIPLNNNHLLGLNAQMGTRLWELEDCFLDNYLDENTGLLYGYGGERFDVIDVVKGEKILQKTFEGSKEKYGINPYQSMCTLANDGLYFTCDWYYPVKFGKVNIHTQEIEFVQELGVEKGVKARKPVYHNGRLYILDTVGTLHIFEE
jgi:outer membrane protein assembly factor BamB